eukprot:1750963-Rhodomonas_salina.4
MVPALALALTPRRVMVPGRPVVTMLYRPGLVSPLFKTPPPKCCAGGSRGIDWEGHVGLIRGSRGGRTLRPAVPEVVRNAPGPVLVPRVLVSSEPSTVKAGMPRQIHIDSHPRTVTFADR